MNQFLISERLKLRHTFLQKLCFLCPLITGIIAFVLASNYVQIDSYNWWYTIILPGMISLMCALGAGIDKKMNDRSVLSLPVPLERVFLAKIWIMAEQIIISCLLIFLFSVFSVLFLKEGSYIAISWERMLGGSVILILCFLWQIPLCMFLGYPVMEKFLPSPFILLILLFLLFLPVWLSYFLKNLAVSFLRRWKG